MREPTGKLKHAYQTIAIMDALIKEQRATIAQQKETIRRQDAVIDNLDNQLLARNGRRL
jgi:hypothetical protein